MLQHVSPNFGLSSRRLAPLRQRSLLQPLLRGERLERRDCPAAIFSLEGPTAPIIEGDTATFTVRLSEASIRTERVLVSTIAETAKLGQDYFFANSQQLLFAPGVTTQRFSVVTRTDTIREGVETLRVVATPTTRAASEATASRLAIYDLVPTTVSVAGVRVTEGNSGTTNADFTVRLTAGAVLPVSVNFATQDVSATAGQDYTATSGTLTFLPGETVKTISVPVLGDRVAETDETFKVLLSNPSRGTTIRPAEAIGTIVNDETDQIGFQITLDFVTSANGEVPSNVRTAARLATQRWEQVITGDLPSFVEESTGLFVDDFRMRVQMGLLGSGGTDGGGNTLANARPLQPRQGTYGLPWLGETGIDPADAGSASLVNILIHEIGHALGFAPGLPAFDRWVTNNGWIGVNAIREYSSTFNVQAAFIPLETQGGAGTAGSHWSESVFDTELMTGIVDAVMPLSRITVGAFADLGYTVNYAAADSYSPPVRGSGLNNFQSNIRLAPTLAAAESKAAGSIASGQVTRSIQMAPKAAMQPSTPVAGVFNDVPKSTGAIPSPKRTVTPKTAVSTELFAALGAASEWR